jgi:hypothetical protein
MICKGWLVPGRHTRMCPRGVVGMILTVCMMVGMLATGAGCGEGELISYAAGFGTGVVTTINQANEAMENVKAQTVELNEQAKAMQEKVEYYKEVAKTDPMKLAAELDPQLSPAINRLVTNIEDVQGEIDAWKDDQGKIDWERMIYALLIGGFGGGTGVNLFKNATAKKAG